MDSGLIKSFDNLMLGLTAQDLEAATAAPRLPPPSGAPVQLEDSGALDPGIVAAFDDKQQGSIASAPPIDERARELAARLVGMSPGGFRPSWTLHVGDAKATAVQLTIAGALAIGRGEPDEAMSTPNQISIDLAVVSRQHCRIDVDADGVATVTDMSSTNGTCVVREHDVLSVGTRPLTIEDGDAIATIRGTVVLATVAKALS